MDVTEGEDKEIFGGLELVNGEKRDRNRSFVYKAFLKSSDLSASTI